MKATDLAIYDWVTYKDKFCVVLGIDAKSDKITLQIRKGDDMGVYLYDVPIADVKPVPLTEELLAYNGARKVGLNTFRIGKWVLEKYADYWKVFIVGHTRSVKLINYVHELQQYFFCGLQKQR